MKEESYGKTDTAKYTYISASDRGWLYLCG